MMIKDSNRLTRVVSSEWMLVTVVFLLALVPRVLNLDTFLTADEDDQLQFAAAFLQAALRHDWGGMLVLGYPGVPTMALGALGLWLKYALATAFPPAPISPLPTPTMPDATLTHRVFLPLVEHTPQLQGIDAMLATLLRQPLDFIVAVRLPMVLTAALAIVLIFFLLRKLLPKKTAILAILLVAFDPFFLANSRVIHVDAPLTYFMFGSFLAFLVYLKDENWRWLVVSSMLGGLAVLSKTPGAILGPILLVSGGFFVWQTVARSQNSVVFRSFLRALVLWGAGLGVVFVALWPSMWVHPIASLEHLIANLVAALNTTHPSSGQFWGKIVTDQSPWYYLVALPFHLTPLTLVGTAMAIVSAGRMFRKNYRTRQQAVLLALLAFVIIFLAAVSVVGRRGIRYLLPVFPVLDVLAVLGWTAFVGAVRQRWASWALAGLIVLQIAHVLTFHPYYFDYTNPLLGGGKIAPEFVVLGWGEGLDRAAEYLDQKPDAGQKTAVAWYSWQFAPYFTGRTVDLSGNEPAYTADYTVFYINQVQRRFPTEELLDYFADRQPEKIIRLGGMDYVWIYPGPIIGKSEPKDMSHPLGAPLNEQIVLRGMNVAPPENGKIPVTLYWQPLDSLPADLNVSLRLTDAAGEIWGQVDRLPIGGLVRTQNWQPGDTIRDEYLLPVDPATPPGKYAFDVQLYDFSTGDVFGQVKRVGGVNIAPPKKPVSLREFEAWADGQPSIGNRRAQQLSDGLVLLGDTFDHFETLPGYRTAFKLYWRAEKPLPAGTAVSLLARAANGGDIPLAELPVGTENYPADHWRRGEIMGQTASIRMPADTPPGEYSLVATVNGAATVTLGKITVRAQAHTFDLPAGVMPAAARFGDAISLAGYTIAKNNGALDLTLFWRADRQVDDDLKVFVHITDAAGNIIAQRDRLPADGARPTLTWVAGEIITDRYHVPLDAAEYTVWVGLYNPLSGERLPVDGGGLPVSDSRLQLRMTNSE